MRNGWIVGLVGTGALVAWAATPGGLARADDKPATAAVEAQRQALVGIWKVNTQLSDDPRAKMREARSGGGGGEQGGGGGGGRGGWGGGGGGWGGGRGGGMGRGGGGWGGGRGGGGGGGSTSSQGGPTPTRAMLLTASQITVTNLTPQVTILDPDGGMRLLHADNKGYSDDSGNEVKAHWDDAKLVVETKNDRGKVKETWTTTDDPRRLNVLVEIDRPYGNAVKIKRVFDAVDPNAPKPDAAQADPSKPASNPDKPNPDPGKP